MTLADTVKQYTVQDRIDHLRQRKLEHTREKQQVIGAMDYDDWAMILPPPELRELTKAISGSGVEVNECKIKGIEMVSNHPSGAFFGPKATGESFRRLLEAHPVYVDPMASLAGAYMVNFYSYRKLDWPPEFSYDHLKPLIDLYALHAGIGAKQHFCQDLRIGLELGWGGLLDKIRYYRGVHPEAEDFYDGLEAVVLGVQNWIGRTAQACRDMAEVEPNPQLRQNLLEMAEINEKLITEPPETFREACQWMVWYLMTARMFNGSGSLGRLDVLLQPYYERDVAAGILDDEEAILHLACMLLRDTSYIQLGGPDAEGRDVTSRVSYLVLEAAHRLKIPANIGVCVGEHVDPGLLRRGVEIQFDDKMGIPKFLGIENTAQGFTRNGYPIELGRERAYSGCHWSAIPGREYTMNDTVKVNLARVFEVAFKDMVEHETDFSVALLWDYFTMHLQRAVDTIKAALDFHLEHMHQVMPELVLDLLCHGPIERGLDASHGGVEFYNLCCDAAGLATVADSFAAVEQRIEQEGRLTWEELVHYLETDWAGPEGERARLMMKNSSRYGKGGALGDKWAQQVSRSFTEIVASTPTPNGFNVVPGIFSWALTVAMGKRVGATPNGRHAKAPISHGASPDPGFRKDGAPSAMAVAVASVQPGYGNTAPMQIDFDPGLSKDEGGLENVMDLVRTHFLLGGTQINMNVMDSKKVLEAHKDPSKYPDLIVRVTGFSAYFASLSPEFRQLVVDRIIAES